MDRQITASVGAGGVNRQQDVRTVQELLNKVFPGWGGPEEKLAVDGLVGPKTIGAIRRFQQAQLGTIFTPDGRVDPGHRTLHRLNHINGSSERPGGLLSISREPVDHVRQPTNMVCWAAAGTMLVAARDQQCMTIETVLGRADARDPGYGYLAKYQANQGLPPQDTTRYTRALGLRVGPPMCFTVQGWANLMRQNGAIGVVGLSPFLHIRVISEMRGDGSVFGTFFTVHDPGVARTYKEVLVTFAQRYEDAAFIDSRMDQLWHK